MLKIISLLLFLSAVSIAYADNSFVLSSLDEAKILSQQTQQPVLLIFGSNDCRFCNALKEDIITNKLSPAINRYIVCYINIKDNQDLKNRYNISVVPDSLILIKQNEKFRTKGYLKDSYIKWLNNARQ